MDKQSTVIFCGENPELRLYQPGATLESAFGSYWHCTYSPHGTGQALVLRLEVGAHPAYPNGLTRIYADNLDLGRFLADTLVQHFPGIDRVDLSQVAVTDAQLRQTGDAREGYRVMCEADGERIELAWGAVLDVRMPSIYANFIVETAIDSHLDVQNIICPVADGQIHINGVNVEGQVDTYHDGTMHRSSGFLAFSETWIRHFDGEATAP